MRTKTILLSSIFCIASVAGYIAFYHFKSEKTADPPLIIRNNEHKTVIEIPQITEAPVTKKKVVYTTAKKTESLNQEVDTTPEPVEVIETVESLKEQITDIAVEYTDDLPLLNDIIQESASEPLELWEGDWVSIDDWKRKEDAFTIEKNEDGSFELIPEKDSSHSYSYNEETQEFVWELDYYGKIVTHKARFISEDVMVLMKISGIKVALDIYKRDAG